MHNSHTTTGLAALAWGCVFLGTACLEKDEIDDGVITAQQAGPTVLSSGGIQTCAVADGSLVCWGTQWPPHGFESIGMMTPEHASALAMRVPPGNDYEEVVVGWSHGCARATDGRVDCWSPADGWDDDGSCCSQGFTPPDRTFVRIYAHPFYGAGGLDEDGILHHWDADGSKAYPALGPAITANIDGPPCVLDAQGDAHCASPLTGVEIGTDGPFVDLVGQGCGLRPDGHVACLRSDSQEFVTLPVGPFRQCAWGQDRAGWGGPPSICGVGFDGRIRCQTEDGSSSE